MKPPVDHDTTNSPPSVQGVLPLPSSYSPEAAAASRPAASGLSRKHACRDRAEASQPGFSAVRADRAGVETACALASSACSMASDGLSTRRQAW
eukprot:scaffold6957_cov65-Phaeocystis_antarctica.AAC.3